MKIQEKKKVHIRWMLVCYDILIYLLSAILLLRLYGGNDRLSNTGILQQMCISMVCIFGIRLLGNIYGQVWRYGGIQCYMRLIFADGIACVLYMIIEILLPVESITFTRMLSLVSVDLLGAFNDTYVCIAMHINAGTANDMQGRFWTVLLKIFSGIDAGREKEIQKIKIAIIGRPRRCRPCRRTAE